MKCNWILILNLAVWKRKILKPPSEILTKIDCKCANFKHILYLIWKTFDIFNYCRCKIYLWCSKAFFMFLIFIYGDISGILLGCAVWHSKTLFFAPCLLWYFSIHLFSENLPLTAVRDLFAKIQQTVCSIFVELDNKAPKLLSWRFWKNLISFPKWILSIPENWPSFFF